MPCRYDEPYPTNNHRAELDRLTAENDMLRETILGLLRDDPDLKIDQKALRLIQKDQVKHRKEDLKRLEDYFRKHKEPTNLGLVMLADPKKPLKPQLGFDPDEV